MTDPSDPPRWLDPGSAASARVRKVLEDARADVGSDDEVARLEAALLPLLGPPLTGPGAAGTSGASGASSGGAAKVASVSAAKLALGAGAAVVAASAALWFASPGRLPEGPPRASSSPATAPSPASPGTVATEATSDATESATPEPPAPPAAAQEPPSPQSAPSRQPGGAPVASSVSEADLLGQAQAALAADPARALRLADQHRARFPGGVLGQEREVIAIEALVRLGRTSAARDRAARFAKAFPSSAHRSKIDSLVAPR